MSLQKLNASLRKRPGKGPARRLRSQGQVPAVLYGRGVETTPIAVDPRALVKALAGPKRTNTVLELSIAGLKEPCTAMVKDHQYDPVSRELLHVDLYAVNTEAKIKAEVPLEVIGRSAGEQLGGTMSKLYRRIPVECMPLDIPESVKVDVTPLNVNETLAAKDIAMPENVTLLLSEKAPVVTILAKRVEVETTEEGEEGAEGEAAADAAPAAEGDKAEEPAK